MAPANRACSAAEPCSRRRSAADCRKVCWKESPASKSGRIDPVTGRMHPWPWTIDAEGQGSFFPTKEEAIAFTRQLQARGVQSIDVGCLQVNLMNHPDAFHSLEEAFDPDANARYAVRFLTQLRQKTGTWDAAAAWYHSASPDLGIAYRQKVVTAMAEEARDPYASSAIPACGMASRGALAIGPAGGPRQDHHAAAGQQRDASGAGQRDGCKSNFGQHKSFRHGLGRRRRGSRDFRAADRRERRDRPGPGGIPHAAGGDREAGLGGGAMTAFFVANLIWKDDGSATASPQRPVCRGSSAVGRPPWVVRRGLSAVGCPWAACAEPVPFTNQRSPR